MSAFPVTSNRWFSPSSRTNIWHIGKHSEIVGGRVSGLLKAGAALVFLSGLTLCSPSEGQNQAAPIYSGPNVLVNGQKSLAHEVLPGDLIEIPANDKVVLQPSGDEVHVEPLSSAAYVNANLIELRQGTASVSTKTGVAVHVHHYTVQPMAVPGKPPYDRYEVMWAHDGGRVRVYEGEVSVSGCEKKMTVAKDQIAELGRDCKVGAYLRSPGGMGKGDLAGIGGRSKFSYSLLLRMQSRG